MSLLIFAALCPPMETVIGELQSLGRDGLSGGWANDELLGPSVREDGYIRNEDAEELSENIILFFEGLLLKVTNNVPGYSKERSLEVIMKFITNSLHFYNLKATTTLKPFSQ